MKYTGIILCLAAASRLTAQTPAEEAKRFEGTWTVFLAHKNGAKIDEEKLKGMTVVFKDGAMTIRDGDGQTRAKFSADPETKPKTFTVQAEKGANSCAGIYQFELLTLKVAWALPGKPKPEGFPEKPDAGVNYMILRRSKE